ncbi:F-box only protein 7 [Danio rerio]|uniref:F-box only protein 7 n=1 Tax=Danio rerio TaxID=7955 RepID=Q4V8X6_DANRE|nr:F-box only protein 7 [Danio rerio]AAH97156.1 F-box protein 7 [Danio rerio]|eukprot:NP_001020670.1 F-box only protein 7 [Danio rerio]
MKLRVRISRQTCRLELQGEEPSLAELRARVRESLLTRFGLRSDLDFRLSLNGKEDLLDTGQSLSSCGVVSGDLISVILPASSLEETQTSSAAAHQTHTDQQAGGSHVSSSSSVMEQHVQERVDQDLLERVDQQQECVDLQQDCMDQQQQQEQECVCAAAPPLLCCEAEDGLLPLALERLLDSSTCRSPSDCLMLALHLLLLETGFIPQGGAVSSGEMPIGWQAAGGVFRLQYVHPLLENSLVSVVAVPMGQTLVINAVLKMETSLENSRKLLLKPDEYVTAEWTGGSSGVVYRDLRRLSRLVRDQLVYPLMATARQALGLPLLFGLPVLPPELLLRLLRLLDVRSLVSLSAVCRHLNTATHDASLWRHLLHRDFRVSFPAGHQHRDTDWRELYKQKYRQRKEAARRGRHWFYPPPISPLIPFPSSPAPLPLYPPGIIGGDYDQMPVILPRPRFHPIGPLPGMSAPVGRRSLRPAGSGAADVRRAFI